MIASPDAKTFARTRSIDFGQQGEEGTGGGGRQEKKSGTVQGERDERG